MVVDTPDMEMMEVSPLAVSLGREEDETKGKEGKGMSSDSEVRTESSLVVSSKVDGGMLGLAFGALSIQD